MGNLLFDKYDEAMDEQALPGIDASMLDEPATAAPQKRKRVVRVKRTPKPTPLVDVQPAEPDQTDDPSLTDEAAKEIVHKILRRHFTLTPRSLQRCLLWESVPMSVARCEDTLTALASEQKAIRLKQNANNGRGPSEPFCYKAKL